MSDAIPKRPLGKTGEQVSILGIGGHHLGSAETYEDAERIVHEAIDAGVNFFDNCWEYHNGKSELWMGRALAGRRSRVFLMTKVCTHGRSKELAMRMLDESLRRLGTDHLDLWQAHGMAFESDPARAYAPDGVLAAFDLAKQQGKVRFVGFTGHKSPEVHAEMLRRGYPFDAVQMPLNPFDATFRSFVTEVIPEAERRGVAVLGMKSMCGHGEPIDKRVATAEELLRYAMSLPVATTISGIDSLAVLRQNLSIARGFTPMTEAEMAALRARCRTSAADGRFELYKVSLKFDNPEARTAHGFPNDTQSTEVKEKLEDVAPP
jgi:predicted aldo/keto reductase-like oxidoreductase